MVRFGLRQTPSEASVKFSSKSDLFWLFKIRFRVLGVCLVWYGLVWLGMVRFGLRQLPSEASVKFSSRSDLFWLF